MILDKAIYNILGVTIEEMRSTSRTERVHIARLIYADIRRLLGADASRIAKDLCKSRRNVYYYLQQAREQLGFNCNFTRLYQSVASVATGSRPIEGDTYTAKTRRKPIGVKIDDTTPPIDLFPETLPDVQI